MLAPVINAKIRRIIDLNANVSHAPSRPETGTLPLRSPPVAQLLAASVAGAAVLTAVGYLLVGATPAAFVLALGGYLGATALSIALLRRGYPYADLGLCNLTTLTRLALACALLAPLVAPAVAWTMVTVAILAFALDGVDGWLARSQGRESAFGARFDMEVDAWLGLVLALNAWAAGTVGAVVILLGLPRYVFAAASWYLPWIARPLPDRFGRKLVCVVQITALIVLQVPALSSPVAIVVVTAALAALTWSFGRDLLWLWRTR